MEQATSPPPDLHDLLGTISAQLRLTYARSTPERLGFVTVATLRHLVRHGATAVSTLASSDRVTSQAISLRVRPLLDAELVTRQSDPADGRRAVLTATTSGEAVIEAAEASVRATLSRATDALSHSDRAVIAAAVPALARLATNLQEEH